MICPDCRGRGEVRKAFLWFKWRLRCSRCQGTGHIEADTSRKPHASGAGIKRPPPSAVAADDRRRDTFREWADNSPSWSSRETTSERHDSFVAGEGGRSGGGGGGGTWGDDRSVRDASSRDDREHPVIVDPFVGDGAAMASSNAESAEAGADESHESASTSDDGSSSDESDADGGTSY